ncbi:MAG: hypothetical protein P1V36_07410 [Planctomycetota bacterium]|nr:hypothetical protein [Planctomycetota bacterium]
MADTWDRGGRSLRWRLGMIVGGALVGGAGVALYLHPPILIWLLSGALVAGGALLILSGICARGR